MGRIERHNRRSIRLKGYDYTRDGAYFVTICTQGRAHVFGSVAKGEMRLNECGRVVADCWTWLAEQYPYVHLDQWIVMPNHIHGIIVITDDPDETQTVGAFDRGVQNRVHQTRQRYPVHPRRDIVAT